MNIEEIKEVIDNLNGVVKGIYRMDEAGLETEDIETILNYITNLQKRLDFMIDRNDEKQDRIDKALEIIEQKRGEYDIPDELEKLLKGEK